MSHNLKTQISWLRLIRSKNLGRVNFFRFLEIFGSAENVIEQLPSYLSSVSSKRKIDLISQKEAEKELENLQKFGAKILLFCDEKYPALLKEIPDPAPVLTVKGNMEFLHHNIVAIVGPRNPSLNATSFTKKITTDLAKNSLVIASGMARGIDTTAHENSIASGTIAVIAGGINHIYPQENSKLYEKIAECGLLISENSFGANPERYSFVQRNRLISGLSLAVIVIEAGLKSGSLTTARFAAEQGREVFAMPGSPLDPRCQGTNRLIKEGAKMLENSADVLEELCYLRHNFTTEDLRTRHAAPTTEITQNNQNPQSQFSPPGDDEIKKIREEILKKLNFTPLEIEEIISELKVPARLVNSALMQLELMEKVRVDLGKVVLL